MYFEKEKMVALMEKKAREEKKAFWKDIAKRLKKLARRRTPVINLEKIEKLSKKNPEKVLVIVGKVLGKGELNSKTKVAALSFSEKALQEIQKKGEAITLNELVKEKPSNMVIVE